MAASAELGERLRLGRRALEELCPQVRIVGDWARADGLERYWQLELELAPIGVAASAQVPASTRWILLAQESYPAGRVDLYPAREGGLVATFPHQRANLEQERPWRTGQICTSESVSGHPIAIARTEPRTAEQRLRWHVERGLQWLVDASNDALLKPGDPFELPMYATRDDGPTIAFRGGAAEFERWQRRSERSGLAELVGVSRNASHHGVRVFRSAAGLDVVRADWGTTITNATATVAALWVRLEGVPYLPPWAAPRTWGELRAVAANQGTDLDRELRPLCERIRDGVPHYLLLGFPIPERVGAGPVAMHWIAAELPALNRARSKTPVPGFRVQAARWIADRTDGVLANSETIEWVATSNWHPGQLGSRGRYTGAFGRRPIALVGAGALGSALGSMLVRGGADDLAILDDEALAGGNLVRHELSMDELGANKARGLATRLNAIAPNARVRGFDASLPNINASTRAALDRAEIIIDTTGDDDVIDGLASFVWPAEKRFASIAISFGARHLYIFTSRGQRFPAAEFLELFAPWLGADMPEMDAMPWEGIGCWNPIFPARADDVAALAALASRQLDGLLASDHQGVDFRVFERGDDGTITCVREPR